MNKNIIAVDTGITTGYAVVNSEGVILETGNFKPDDILDNNDASLAVLHFFQTLKRKYNGLYAVIEYARTPTHSPLDVRISFINAAIISCFFEQIRVDASVWKNTIAKSKVIYPKGKKLTQHEKDAVGIATYYLQHVLPKSA